MEEQVSMQIFLLSFFQFLASHFATFCFFSFPFSQITSLKIYMQIWHWFPGVLLASIIRVCEQGQTCSFTGNHKICKDELIFPCCQFKWTLNYRVSSSSMVGCQKGCYLLVPAERYRLTLFRCDTFKCNWLLLFLLFMSSGLCFSF